MITINDWRQWRSNLGQKFQQHPLEIIQWEATMRCDMQCKHCGSPQEAVSLSQELTTDEVVSAFTQIKNNFDLRDFKFITITGGEPFLRKDLFQILELFKSFGLTTTIQTNGNYLANHLDKIPVLLDLGVRGIGLDLDGTESVHDDLRGRGGHYIQNRNLTKELLKFSNILHTIVTTVVTKENLESLPLLWIEIQKINPHRWRLLPLEKMGRSRSSSLALDTNDYLALLGFIKEKRILNIGNTAVQTELGCIGWLGQELEGWVRPYIWSCIAGRTCMGILYDGSLSACSNINRSFIQGNVRTDSIKDVWENGYEIFRNRPKQEVCKKCSEKHFCTLPMHKLDDFGALHECVFNLMQKGGDKSVCTEGRSCSCSNRTNVAWRPNGRGLFNICYLCCN